MLTDHTHVRLNRNLLTTDVAEFGRLLDLAEQTTESSVRRKLLLQAGSLYKQGLLPGYYDEWISQAQQGLSERYAKACRMLARDLAKEGSVELALEALGAALQTDPYHEASYRLQMRLYAALGQPAAVQLSYQHLERLFREELGVSPSAKTREWADLARRDAQAVVRTREATGTPEHRVPTPVRNDMKQETTNVGTSPSRPLSFPPSNLPFAFTRFFGRDEQRKLLKEWLKGSDRRLVTLTGPGGSGKTRLAVEVAREVAPLFEGRVWFVDLAALQDGRLLPFALAHTLQITLAPKSDPLEQVVEKLEEAASLLVLDNFEHLLRATEIRFKGERAMNGECALLVRLLLERVSNLTCLVTSRQPLHLGGEQELSVPALPVPANDQEQELLSRYASIALYMDRARGIRPEFALTEHNTQAVATLCQRLEGMPLAIEMAAAWAKTLPPSRMLERLEHQLDLLVSRQRDVPARQKSLRATFEWSYELLEPELQACFARLSVFRGGFDLEAAEALCGEGILLSLSELQERSLLIEEDAGEWVRYRILESLRQYAREKLSESGELEKTQQRHAEYFLALAETMAPNLRGPQQERWLGRLDAEHDNLRTAMEWWRGEAERAEIGLRLCGAMLWFWILRGYCWEGRAWYSTALSSSGSQGRAKALYGIGWLAYSQGDYVEARSNLEESLSLRRELEDRVGVADTLNILGNVAIEQADYVEARSYLEEGLSLRKELEDRVGIASALNNLGNVALELSDYAEARAYYEESLAIRKEIGDKAGIAATLCNVGHVIFQQGDYKEARVYYEQSFSLRQEIRQTGGVASSYTSLGNVAFQQGDYAEAQACYRKSLSLWKEIGNKGGIAYALEGLAYVALARGQAERATRWMAAAERLRLAMDAPLPPNKRTVFDRARAEARQSLDEEVFASAWDAGRQMTLEQAIEEALA